MTDGGRNAVKAYVVASGSYVAVPMVPARRCATVGVSGYPAPDMPFMVVNTTP